MARHTLSAETLSDLRRQLAPLALRSAERRQRIQAAAAFYGVSEPTLYRLLRQRQHPRALGRADRGQPRVLPKAELERYLDRIGNCILCDPLVERELKFSGRPQSHALCNAVFHEGVSPSLLVQECKHIPQVSDWSSKT